MYTYIYINIYIVDSMSNFNDIIKSTVLISHIQKD